MNRTGHPRLAVVATAVLFVLTTGIAALISYQKSRQAEVVLGELQPRQALNMYARFPVGWEVSSAEAVAGGQLVVANPSGSEAGPHLFLFRLRSPLFGGRQLSRAALWPIRVLDPEAQLGQLEFEAPARLAGQDSRTYSMVLMAPALGPGVRFGLANITVAPDRQILGVLLMTEGGITARDRRLVRQFSDSVVYEPTRAAPPSPAEEPLDDTLDDAVDDLQDVEDVDSGSHVDYL